MPRVFISHANQDKEAARQIAVALNKAGVEPWLDENELYPGIETLKAIARVLDEVDYFALVLTPTALTKEWVLTETRMALTSEIERRRPRVVVLWIEDCEVPIELRHKLYLDFRDRFHQALGELADYLLQVSREAPTPKQAIMADMISDADPELWGRLNDASSDWSQLEVADLIRGLRSDQLEAVVAMGQAWRGGQKLWESDLTHIVSAQTKLSKSAAPRVVRDLVNLGLLEEADDLDYSKQPEQAYYDSSLLWIIHNTARRSGLFPALPPPLPERLSTFLAHDGPLVIFSSGWYAVRYPQSVRTALDTSQEMIAVVQRHSPPRTWGFRSHEDNDPLSVNRGFSATDLIPDDPLVGLPVDADNHRVGFDITTFDDLGLLGR